MGLTISVSHGKTVQKPTNTSNRITKKDGQYSRGLFPKHPPLRLQIVYIKKTKIIQITKEEILNASNKAPGPDGVPNEMLTGIIKHKPEKFLDVFITVSTKSASPHYGKMQDQYSPENVKNHWKTPSHTHHYVCSTPQKNFQKKSQTTG